MYIDVNAVEADPSLIVDVYLNGEQVVPFIADDEAGYVVMPRMRQKQGVGGSCSFVPALAVSGHVLEYQSCACDVLTGSVEIRDRRTESPCG